MKKIYLQPKTVSINVGTIVLTSTSTLGVGDEMSSGSADGRRNNDMWDDEDY